MKVRDVVLPALGAVMLGFSGLHLARSERSREHPDPSAPVATIAGDRLAGTGVVEPADESTRIGTHRAGVVERVAVVAGDVVAADATLFCLDRRAAAAELEQRASELALAEAELMQLRRLPRSETLPPLQARSAAARARLEQLDDDLARTDALVASQNEAAQYLVRAQKQRDTAWHELRAADAELVLAKAGAWAPEVAVAAAGVDRARAAVDRGEVELELLCVHAPRAATVLRVDVRAGELVGAAQDLGLVTLGDVRTLHVRAEFDEDDAARFVADAPAHAVVRGTAAPIPLRLVRVEPLVVPKSSLTGAPTERTDTRVLQVVYAVIDPPEWAPRVGQQLDVYVELAP